MRSHRGSLKTFCQVTAVVENSSGTVHTGSEPATRLAAFMRLNLEIDEQGSGVPPAVQPAHVQGSDLGTTWEPRPLFRAPGGSALLACARRDLQDRVKVQRRTIRVHSWGSRGRGFESRRPDKNLQVRRGFGGPPRSLFDHREPGWERQLGMVFRPLDRSGMSCCRKRPGTLTGSSGPRWPRPRRHST
jgi:hypothetical protein